jgi:hypothetical protein
MEIPSSVAAARCTSEAEAWPPDEPLALPRCAYPRAADVAAHGIQALPDVLPRVDLARAAPHRSRRHRPVAAALLTPARVCDLARVVAESFARREPQCRHLRPPALPPLALVGSRHRDALGSEAFGPWTAERLLFWFIRLLVLTDPTSPRSAIRLSTEALEQSLAILDADGRVIGGAINETLPHPGASARSREGDPFLDAVLAFTAPVLALLGTQDEESLATLHRDAHFAAAHADGRVGHHFMVARSDALPKADAFELVAATAERYRELGFAYVVVEATNQWTGAACELLRGVRVHFAPFRARRLVAASRTALPHETSSPDGFVAAKDSGSMLYVLRLG